MADTIDQGKRKGRLRAVAAAAGSIVLLLIAGWAERRQVAGHFVNRKLATAGVPARYRLVAVGPFAQVIEDVRIGDPARPDLVARRVRLDWRYGFDGPSLVAVGAEGVRIAGTWRNGRLSLGSIDRLLPRSTGGGARLPDMRLTIGDTHVALTTPAGMVSTWISGSGNPSRRFAGMLGIDAPSLATGGCAVERTTARLSVRIAGGMPRLQGPLAIGAAACPARSLTIGAGTAAIDMRLPATLDSTEGRLTLAGFAGRIGVARFGPARGTAGIATAGRTVAGQATIAVAAVAATPGHVRSATFSGTYRLAAATSQFNGRVLLAGFAASAETRAAVHAASSATNRTPLGPIGARLGRTIDAMLGGSDVDARIALTSERGLNLRITGATIRSRLDTATLTGNLTGGAEGWMIDGALAGDTLPRIDVRVARNSPRAPIEAVVRMAPYRAGPSSLAITPLQLTSARRTTRFATAATISGPVGNGSIEGLVVPIEGSIDRSGALRVGEGCAPVRFGRVQLAAMKLDPGRIDVCGAPILARSAAGAIRFVAGAHGIALTGSSGSAPLTLRASEIRVAQAGFAADRLAVTLGPGSDPTRLAIGSLAGTLATRELAGRFADADGSIANVPLALSGGGGTWRLAGGALRLEGALQVSDRLAPARFAPLSSGDVALALVAGRIDAAASLRLPAREQTIALVTLRHDLASGAGGAVIKVPGITFARGGLQPEMLTPLTLGVVANVAGTVAGDGRIDWTADGVTSGGTFRTDRLDFAAAFGPVTGLSGAIGFTDLLGLISAPHQEARIAQINPGVVVADGIAHYRLLGGNRVGVEDARWPFAGGTLSLDPATLDFSQAAERHLTFRVAGLDAAAFIQQLDFPNVAATGTFDGRLPMIFDAAGGRIEGGALAARSAGTLAYVGELSRAQLGTMGNLAFDALKSIRYSGLAISLDGKLDGEIVSRVRFEGVRQATGERGIVARMIRNLPFRFNIAIRAPFRGLVGSAESYMNPALLLQAGKVPAVQPAESAPVR